MKTKKRFLAVVLAAALLVAGLTGCKDALRGVAQKISGSSGEVQEEDTTRWADTTADPLIIQGIADASAKFDTAMVDGTLYAVFNGIWSRQTNYFAAPTGTLTVMACGARSFASGPIVSGACVSTGTDSSGSVAMISSGCTAAVSSVPAVSARAGSCMPVKISSAESAPHRIRFIG
mgnify:FL=1